MSFASLPNVGNGVLAAIDSWHLKAIGHQYGLSASHTQVFGDDGLQYFATTQTVYAANDKVMIRAGVGGSLPANMTANTIYHVLAPSGAGFGLSLTEGGTPVVPDAGSTQPLYIYKSDVAFYSLRNLHKGVVSVKNVGVAESHAFDITRAAILNAKAEIMDTSKTNLLKLLDTLSKTRLQHLIKLSGGDAICSTGLEIPNFGLGWELVCEGDADKDRYLEITSSRQVNRNEITALLTTAAPTLGTPDAADSLYLLNSLSDEGSLSAGIEALYFGDAAGTVIQEIGGLQNCSLRVKSLFDLDILKREDNYGASTKWSVDALQASATELAQLQALSSQAHFVKAKLLADGTMVTLGNGTRQQTGINWEFLSDKDSTGRRLMKYSGGGNVKLSEIDGLFV